MADDIDPETIKVFNACNDYLSALIELAENAPDAKEKANAAGTEWDKLDKEKGK